MSVKRNVTVPDGPAIGHSVSLRTLHRLAQKPLGETLEDVSHD
jgi:hypothetical protein